jgi:stress response protein YsnF
VVKEEVRVRKDSVQDEQVVEEDVRKEEVDIDDETTGRRDR